MVRHRFVLFNLGLGSWLCRDNAHHDLIATELGPGMNDNQVLGVRGESEGRPTVFGVAMLGIVHAQGERIAEHQGRALERDAMFGDIGVGFGRIPLEVIGRLIAHALAFCLIRSASMKVSMSCTI